MKTKMVEIKHKGVSLKITGRTAEKNGVNYEEWTISDYTSGQRKRHVRASLEDAKVKARDVCEALATGNQMERKLILDADLRADVRKAMRLLGPLDINIEDAVRKFVDAVNILDGKADVLIAAALHWKHHGPVNSFAEKDLGKAVDEFLARKTKLSEKRKKNLSDRLTGLANQFAGRKVHEIRLMEVEDYLDRQPWSDLTRNVSLGDFKMFFRDAVKRAYTPADPTLGIDRKRGAEKNRDIGTFTPEMTKTMLTTMQPELRVPFAVWCFAGVRKSELARLDWGTLRTALSTNFLKISEEVGLKTGARDIPLEPNLRLWIVWWLNQCPQANDYLLPEKYRTQTALDDLGRVFARRAKLKWIPNAARHSYITMRLRRDKDAPAVAIAAGNSLQQIENHYFNRNPQITEEIARCYFSVVPGDSSNVVPMQPQIAADPGTAASVIGWYACQQASRQR
jgi:hypothetical protein